VNQDHQTNSAAAHGCREAEPARLIEKAAEHTGISPAAMLDLLDRPETGPLDKLFAAARRQRERYFGNRVFLYGFLYVSTHCRNQCRFCFYRRSNTQAVRYRKTPEQITESARRLARSGVHLIDLTAGEDPCFYGGADEAFAPALGAVQTVKAGTGLPVMASFGVVPEPVMDRLVASGADWYACYQETHNRQLFEQLRVGQSYTARLHSKQLAKAKGLLIEEGLLCGVGETPRDLIDSFAVMSGLGADQVRVMTFVPQAGTPMQDHRPASGLRECIIIALMRLVFPGLLIPASLDVDGLAGLRRRLDAGANVVTSLVPPGLGLAGVAQSALDIEDGRRTVEGIAPTLHAAGLQTATAAQYRRWITARRRNAADPRHRMAAPC
jgi:methylornithine synthase